MSSSPKPEASATRIAMLSARSTLSSSVSRRTSIRCVFAVIRSRGKPQKGYVWVTQRPIASQCAPRHCHPHSRPAFTFDGGRGITRVVSSTGILEPPLRSFRMLFGFMRVTPSRCLGGSAMGSPTQTSPKAALSDYLAAERTMLAWIRTGLALMGFGFVVARFGLFLRQLQVMQRAAAAQSYGLSLWFGTALIAVGVFVNLFAGWQHARLVRLLDRGDPVRSRPAGAAVTIAVFLALVGLAMTVYLISVRGSAQATRGNISRN